MALEHSRRLPLITVVVLAVACLCDFPTYVSIGGQTASSILTFSVTLAVLLSLPYAARGNLRQTAPFLPLVLFAVWSTALGIGFGLDQGGYQTLTVIWAFVGIGVITSASTNSQVAEATHLQLIRVGFIISVAYILFVVAQGFHFGSTFPFGPRSFALEALLLLALAVPRWPGTRLTRWFPAVALVAIASSLSRTALALSALLLAVRGAQGRNGFRPLAFVGIALGGLGLLLVGVLSTPLLYERFFVGDQGLRVGTITISTQGRDELWPNVLQGGLNSPLIGHGPGSVRTYIASFDPNEAQPHNDLLRVFYETGVIGLALFVGGLIWLGVALASRASRASTRQESEMHVGALLALAAFLGGSLTDNSVIYTFVMAPLAVLVACASGLPIASTRAQTLRPTSDLLSRSNTSFTR